MKEFNMTLEETLNDLLVKLFKDILEIEAKSLITEEFKDISYNDMHIIEAVGIDEPQKYENRCKTDVRYNRHTHESNGCLV